MHSGFAEFWRSVALLGLVIVVGCGQPAVVNTPLDPTHERLLKIGLAYQEFTAANQKPPQSEKDLKPLLAKSGADDSVWTSARDQAPFVIMWNVDLTQPPTWATSTPVLAYEQRGKDGKRLVRTVVGSVEELSAEDFAKASFPPGHTPAL
jgi:hypothetical protein